jgi:hypothetical protein
MGSAVLPFGATRWMHNLCLVNASRWIHPRTTNPQKRQPMPSLEERAMRYSFTVRVSGLSTDAYHYENALYEAGCDDALIAVIDDTIFVDFDREATSFEEAVRSATLNIEKAGGKAIEVKRIME